MLLPFFRTSWCVGVLNSAIFNSFHNSVEFGTILEGLQNFGGGFEHPKPPPPYATAYVYPCTSGAVTEQKRWWWRHKTAGNHQSWLSSFHIRRYQTRNKLLLSASQSLKVSNARQLAVSTRGPHYVASHAITGASGATGEPNCMRRSLWPWGLLLIMEAAFHFRVPCYVVPYCAWRGDTTRVINTRET